MRVLRSTLFRSPAPRVLRDRSRANTAFVGQLVQMQRKQRVCGAARFHNYEFGGPSASLRTDGGLLRLDRLLPAVLLCQRLPQIGDVAGPLIQWPISPRDALGFRES